MSEAELIEKIRTNVIQGRVTAEDEGFDEGFEGEPATVELVEEAIDREADLKALIIDGLTGGMNAVGGYFESGRYLIPDMLASAEAVGEAMDILAPHLEGAGVQSKGRFLIATVKGDLHDIGKNIVSIMLKGAGYEIVDLGTDVPTEKIVQAVREHGPRFLGLSALLTTTMREMENVIRSLESAGMRDTVKVLVGGAPTSPEFAQKIGADVHCADAFQAVDYTGEQAA
ncbi:MAG: corrinoid protein [Nitrospirota bacterium]|jgi:5-methyltetrahydrofolate--homocysteine methyltransferase